VHSRRALYPYFGLICLSTMSLGAVFTMLGEFRDRLGFSETGLGVMVSIGFFAAVASQLGLARYADRGHATAMIRGGLVVLAVALLAMSVAEELWQFTLARAVLGVGLGCLFPSIRRMVIAFDRSNVGANLGLLGSFDVAGFVVGPLLAGILVELVGFRAPFLVLGAATALFVPFVARLPADAAAAARPQRVLRELLARRAMRATLVVAVGWFAMIGTFESVWAVLLTDRGAETWLIAVTLSIIVVPMVFLAPFAGRLAQRHGPIRVGGVGVLLAVPCVIGYGFATSLTVLVVLAVLQGFSDAVTFPASQVGAALAADDDQLAASQGLMGATLEITAGTMALVAGFVYDHWGPEALFTATGVLMVVGVGMAAWIARPLVGRRDAAVFGQRPELAEVPIPATP
jgi:MFS family permease